MRGVTPQKLISFDPFVNCIVVICYNFLNFLTFSFFFSNFSSFFLLSFFSFFFLNDKGGASHPLVLPLLVLYLCIIKTLSVFHFSCYSSTKTWSLLMKNCKSEWKLAPGIEPISVHLALPNTIGLLVFLILKHVYKEVSLLMKSKNVIPIPVFFKFSFHIEQ